MYQIGICDGDEMQREEMRKIAIKFKSKKQLDISLYDSGRKVIEDVFGGVVRPDILIMDIGINNENGINIAKEIYALCPECQIIFISQCMDFIIDSYSVPHVWYVLKTAIKLKLPLALERAFHNLYRQESDLVVIPLNHRNHVIDKRNILYCEQELRKVRLIMEEKNIEIYSRLDNLDEIFIPPNFIRCHKSYIVNIPRIKSFTRSEITMQNGDIIPISKSYANKVSFALLRIFSRV